ncbi:type II toxin-antitoxin system death-on-curing family toxin [Corynebacterium sp. NML130628]|uniref:type II toxin-antitoxin system death-on-curing family toxin n=1 Tax=Corynebacterium sp. NML130628 TaxID=1906333 RepID=UPI0008FAED2D|nr:Fic family protein [Corynebacterium sp. NML130628]OIR46324.1 hypothetical protein BJP07_00970 [Corynebacterium sp. NML130628]
MLVELACAVNQGCGDRITESGEPESYLGFTVDRASLESAVYAPFQLLSGHPRYASVFDRGATLTVHIAITHPFADGNKRTALIVGLTYLRLFSIHVRAPKGKEPDLATGEEGTQLMEYIVTHSANLDSVIAHTSRAFQRWADIDDLAQRYRQK